MRCCDNRCWLGNAFIAGTETEAVTAAVVVVAVANGAVTIIAACDEAVVVAVTNVAAGVVIAMLGIAVVAVVVTVDNNAVGVVVVVDATIGVDTVVVTIAASVSVAVSIASGADSSMTNGFSSSELLKNKSFSKVSSCSVSDSEELVETIGLLIGTLEFFFCCTLVRIALSNCAFLHRLFTSSGDTAC